MREKTIKKYKQTAEYIREERKENRHIIACLGSAGITFLEDIVNFCNWCDENGYKDISYDYENQL